MNQQSECQHYWKSNGCRGDYSKVFDRCVRCGEGRERTPTPEEVEVHEANQKFFECSSLAQDIRLAVAKAIPDSKEELFPDRFIEEAAESVIKSHEDRDRVEYAGCDNSLFESSHCVFTPVEGEFTFMGVDVTYFPQNSTGACHFFLYPGHIAAWIEALSKFQGISLYKKMPGEYSLHYEELIPGNCTPELRQIAYERFLHSIKWREDAIARRKEQKDESKESNDNG